MLGRRLLAARNPQEYTGPYEKLFLSKDTLYDIHFKEDVYYSTVEFVEELVCESPMLSKLVTGKDITSFLYGIQRKGGRFGYYLYTMAYALVMFDDSDLLRVIGKNKLLYEIEGIRQAPRGQEFWADMLDVVFDVDDSLYDNICLLNNAEEIGDYDEQRMSIPIPSKQDKEMLDYAVEVVLCVIRATMQKGIKLCGLTPRTILSELKGTKIPFLPSKYNLYYTVKGIYYEYS